MHVCMYVAATLLVSKAIQAHHIGFLSHHNYPSNPTHYGSSGKKKKQNKQREHGGGKCSPNQYCGSIIHCREKLWSAGSVASLCFCLADWSTLYILPPLPLPPKPPPHKPLLQPLAFSWPRLPLMFLHSISPLIQNICKGQLQLCAKRALTPLDG